MLSTVPSYLVVKPLPYHHPWRRRRCASMGPVEPCQCSFRICVSHAVILQNEQGEQCMRPKIF